MFATDMISHNSFTFFSRTVSLRQAGLNIMVNGLDADDADREVWKAFYHLGHGKWCLLRTLVLIPTMLFHAWLQYHFYF